MKIKLPPTDEAALLMQTKIWFRLVQQKTSPDFRADMADFREVTFDQSLIRLSRQ